MYPSGVTLRAISDCTETVIWNLFLLPSGVGSASVAVDSVREGPDNPFSKGDRVYMKEGVDAKGVDVF